MEQEQRTDITTHGPSGVTFRGIVQLDGRTATGIGVPAHVVEALGSGRRPLVRATIGRHTYPSRLAVRSGEYKLPLSAENRERSGVAAGDEVEVTLEPDTAPRQVAVPGDLAEALDREPGVRGSFERLSPSRRQAVVAQVEGAKRPETRRRRIEQAVATLRER